MGDRDALRTASYERPVTAKLIVRTDHGEEWEATKADLDRFGLGVKLDLYSRASDMLLEALGIKEFDDDSAANAVRYMIECALMYDHSPWAQEDGSPWEGEDSGDEVRLAIREALR